VSRFIKCLETHVLLLMVCFGLTAVFEFMLLSPVVRIQGKICQKSRVTNIFHDPDSENKVTIYTLVRSKCIRLVSVRSSHLPFKMHKAVFSSLPY